MVAKNDIDGVVDGHFFPACCTMRERGVIAILAVILPGVTRQALGAKNNLATIGADGAAIVTIDTRCVNRVATIAQNGVSHTQSPSQKTV
jgi:hypothetical protein